MPHLQVERALLSRARRVFASRLYLRAMRALGASCLRFRLERRAVMVWLDSQRLRAMRSWQANCSMKVIAIRLQSVCTIRLRWSGRRVVILARFLRHVQGVCRSSFYGGRREAPSFYGGRREAHLPFMAGGMRPTFLMWQEA